ncbi:MAG: thermonuclease family protein [Candidatus Rokuibacteriota bacterium]
MKGRVVWVVDGDTIHVRVGPRLEKVRYIGVNAPEIPHPEARGWREGGARAFAVNRRLVAGQTARLELDLGRRDSWGRLLAYVWVNRARKPIMANAEMVRRGFAQVMTIPPNVKYQERFLTLQREAREARRGLWGRG